MDHNNTYNNKTNNNQTDDSNRIISGDDKRCDCKFRSNGTPILKSAVRPF